MLLSGLPETDCGLSDFCWTAARRLQLRGQLRLWLLTAAPASLLASGQRARRTTTASVKVNGNVSQYEPRWAVTHQSMSTWLGSEPFRPAASFQERWS